jgi:hypothetical protein
MAAILASDAVDVWRYNICDRHRIGDILVAEWYGFHPFLHSDHRRNFWRNHAYSGADGLGFLVQRVGP